MIQKSLNFRLKCYSVAFTSFFLMYEVKLFEVPVLSPLLVLLSFLPLCLELQKFLLPGGHLVFEDAALHLHASQQPLQLLHLLTPLCGLLLRLLQTLRLFAQTHSVALVLSL